MNLYRLATEGIDLDALPLEESQQPRASFQFESSARTPDRLRLPGELDDVFNFAAQEYGVDVDVLRGIAYAESRFNPDIISGKVKSPVGAIGLMQFMPETAKEYGIDPTDPVQSIIGGAAYLRNSLDKFGGDYERAVASYNWGPNRKAYDYEDWASKAPAETQKYLMTVFDAAGRFKDGANEQTAITRPETQATPLPAGVAPSAAGGGRGFVSPGDINTKLTRTAVPEMTAGSVARDIASGALQIGPTVVQGVGDLIGLASGNRLGGSVREFAKDGKQAIREMVGSERAQAQAQNLAADMADEGVGFGQMLANNKGALADMVLPTIGSMAIPLGAAGAAGKAATLGKAAQGLDKAALAARVASAQQVAGIGATAAQNAASTFVELLDKGVSVQDAYVGAGITVPFSLIAGKLTGGGAEGALIRGATNPASVVKGAAEMLVKAPVREGAQEGGESLGQLVGESVATETMPTANAALKQVGTEALLGAVMGGGMNAAQQLTAPRVENQPTTPQAPTVTPQAPVTPDAAKTQAVDNIAAAILEAEGGATQTAPVQPGQQTVDAGAGFGILNRAKAPAAATIAANTLTGSNLAGMLGRSSDPLLSGISDRRVAAENDAQRRAGEISSLGSQKTDILNPSGQPFKTKFAAELAAKKTPGEVVDVPGGYAVRAEQTTPATKKQQEQPPAQQPILNNGKPFTLAEVGKANQAIGGTAVSVPGGWAIQPPATAQQPASTPATAMPTDATPESSAQSAILGRNSQPIAEGGQPFATREEAKAEKRMQPLMRVAPAEGGGFILKPASERQLAAVEKAAKRLKYPSTGETGPRSLHGFILQIGGLASGAMPDVGFDLNPRVGNRRLFSPRGKTIEQAAMAAKQEGYIQDEDENTLIEALKRSLNVSPVYTPDGYEAMAEAQMQARYEDFLAAEQDGGAENDWSRLTPEELADTGYNDYDEATQAEIRALVAQAEALGVDAESILEDVARRTENATQKDYENAAKSAIEAAIRSSEESRSRDLGQASAEAGPATADTQADPAAVTGPASDVRARNLAALKARMMGQKKPTPTTPPAPNQQATPAPEAVTTNQGAKNGQKETLLKEEQPTGAAAMVSGAPVADTSLNRDSSWVIREKATGKVVMETFDRAKVDALNTAKYEAVPIQQHLAEQGAKKPSDTTKPGGFIENAKKAAGKVDAAPAQPILTSPTKADIEAQQTRAEQAAKAKAAQDKADAARAAKERERKEVAAASVAAADTFELGQDAMANLTGQNDLQFSRAAAKEVRDLVTLHNLSEDNLMYAGKMGGIPVPSIGITKVETPFGGFGEITLIAPKDLIDPEAGVPVYDRDAWTARFPTLNFKKIKAKVADAFYERMSAARDLGGDGGQFMSSLFDELRNARVQSPDKITSLFTQYSAPKMLYAQEALGKIIKPQMRGIKPETPFGHTKAWRDFVAKSDMRNMTEQREREFNREAAVAARAAMAEIGEARKEGVDERTARMLDSSLKSYLDRYITEDGMNAGILDRALRDVKSFGQKEIDPMKMDEAVRKVVPLDDAGYKKWVAGLVEPLFEAPTITVRGSEVPVTLENVVEAMTIGKTAGAEKSMTFGVGKAASMLGKQFKSIDEIKAARDQVVSSASEKEGKKSTEALISEYQNHVSAFYTGKDWKGNIDTWAALDSSLEALTKAGRTPTDGAMNIALQRSGFKRVDAKGISLAKQALEALRDATTDYFEAKPQRAVRLNEFKGAVVPKGTSAEAIALLEENGITVEVHGNAEGAREKAIQKLAKKLDGKTGSVIFSRDTESPRTPAATIRAAITKAYGNLLDKLEGKGLVTIAQTEREAIEAAAQARADKTGVDAEAIAGRMMSMAGLDVKYSANGNIEGFFDRQTGKSFMVADNLTAASAPGTLMHEVGIHMAADGKLEPLFKRAGSLLKTGTQNEFIQRVKARMARAGETSDEEAAAYIVTEYENDRANAPASVTQWIKDFIADVRAWLFSKGVLLKADSLTVADIAAVARENARIIADGKGWTGYAQKDGAFRFGNTEGQRSKDIATVAEAFSSDRIKLVGVELDGGSSDLHGLLYSVDGKGDIRRSVAPKQPVQQTPAVTTWDDLGASKMDALIFEGQDDRIDLKRVQENIVKAGRQIREEFDARMAETLFPGRVAKRNESFVDQEVKPLLQAMAASNVSMEELGDYLLARHAPERNAQIAKVNPGMPDGGAGTNSQGVLMTTQAANDYIVNLSAGKRTALQLLAKRVDAITSGTRDILVTEGLEKASTVAAWEGAYKNYVPLFKDEAAETPGHPVGSGFSVKGGASKRAMGSTKEVTNVLAHVLMQREAAITRAEKNRVGMSLYGLALSNPNKEFWGTVVPKMSTPEIMAELQNMGVNVADDFAGMEATPTIRYVDPNTGLVTERPNPVYKNLDNALVVKVNGEDRVILFNKKNDRAMRLAESLKNQNRGWGSAAPALDAVGKVTRFMASMLTQYNPAFGMVNSVRDVQGALVNLSSTPIKGQQAKVLAAVPAAMKGIARDLRGDKARTQWSDLWVQFQDDGGRTGIRDLISDPYEKAGQVEKDLMRLSKSGKLTPGNAAHAVLDLLSDFNDTLENGVRLAAYKTAIDQGMSRPAAAKLARELTVDFNRKGRTGRELGKLYAFLNASIQGSARTIQTLKGPMGAKIMAGGFALGVLQAFMLAAAGFDDDDIPEFIKSRNLIIPMGGDRYVTIPMALGLHVLPNTGRAVTELVMSGGKDIGEKSLNTIVEIVTAFNPFGGGGDWKTAHGPLTMITPTVMDPVIDLAMNRDFTGRQISKERFGKNNMDPGAKLARESTKQSPSGQVYIGISEAINTATGGTDVTKGAVSPTPEQLRYLATVVGGGVYRETERAINAAVLLARGEEVKPHQVPLGSRFAGVLDDEMSTMSRYYKNNDQLGKFWDEFKKEASAGNTSRVEEMKRDPRFAAAAMNNKIYRAIADVSSLASENTANKEKYEALNKKRAELMKKVNEAVKEAEKQ